MLRLRYASGLDDARKTWTLLVRMADECAHRTVNPGKAFTNICRCIDGGMSMLVEDEAGRAVASIGLDEAESTFSDSHVFYDLWFYVVPEHRNGEATRLLLDEVKALCVSTDTDARLNLFNPRRSKLPRTGAQAVADSLNFNVGGYAVEIRP